MRKLKEINKIMMILIIIIVISIPALAEDVKYVVRKGTDQKVILEITPGTGGKHQNYVTVSSKNSSVLTASSRFVESTEDYDIFEIQLRYINLGAATVVVIIDRNNYDLFTWLIRIEVSEDLPVRRLNNKYVFNMDKSSEGIKPASAIFNLFNPFLLNEGTRVPYRE